MRFVSRLWADKSVCIVIKKCWIALSFCAMLAFESINPRVFCQKQEQYEDDNQMMSDIL